MPVILNRDAAITDSASTKERGGDHDCTEWLRWVQWDLRRYSSISPCIINISCSIYGFEEAGRDVCSIGKYVAGDVFRQTDKPKESSEYTCKCDLFGGCV